jgi:hypothetical protein
MITKFNLLAIEDYINSHLALGEFKNTEKLIDKWAHHTKYCANFNDRKILSFMLQNLENFNKHQIEDHPETESKTELQREEARSILINGFINNFPVKELIGIQPSAAPTTLAAFIKRENGTVSLETEAVKIQTIKARNSAYIFSSIEKHIIENLIQDINVTGSLSIFNFKEDFSKAKESTIEDSKEFNCVIIPESILDPKSFKQNGIGNLIKQFIKDDYKVIESTFIEQDEIYLIKKKSDVDAGIIFIPYIVPFPISPNVIDEVTKERQIVNMARYALFLHPQKDQFVKRFKLTY